MTRYATIATSLTALCSGHTPRAAPNARACGSCHLPDGQGRPKNGALAGLPATSCTACHGADLPGKDAVPPIGGRAPSPTRDRYFFSIASRTSSKISKYSCSRR